MYFRVNIVFALFTISLFSNLIVLTQEITSVEIITLLYYIELKSVLDIFLGMNLTKSIICLHVIFYSNRFK